MIRLVLNDEHLGAVLQEAARTCRHRLFIATADLKDVHVPIGGGRAVSFLELMEQLAERGAEVHVLHSGVPSGPLRERLAKRPLPDGMILRRCPRVHAKAVIVDGRRMYLGSANLTGAGLGAKSARRRNFEAGVWTDDVSLIDPVLDMLQEVWTGGACADCGRREHCPEPLEEPAL
ncbi:MAG TPA: phospholipase D-like domain-containing protein [Phycisphaerae bacterium]|nr:phospholipase D-like domain-containing protein [Phycisphaerae bacterium]